MILPLQLQFREETSGQASAWFLPGASVAHWLAELTRAGWAEASTRLFVVPHSAQNPAPAGLLVVPSKTGSLVSSGMPCRLVAGRLFVPLQAELQPWLDDDEVRDLCPFPISFYHPALGLSGFEEESVVRVWQLIEPPRDRNETWNSARPGAPEVPEFAGILLAQPPTLDDLFGGAENEIGGEGLDKLPPAPNEPGEGPAAKTGRNLRRFFAEGLSKILQKLPEGAQHRTWVNDAEDWAQRQLKAADSQLDQLRNKELHRLLHLLATDPEAGLRHAIPLNQFAHRGIAPPSGRLGSRSLTFDPSRLGGGPADFWNVGPDLQAVLRARYREMADRELQLGRYQRAAYIYAELLGDLVAAANALKQGRHYREAALIYDEHLKNPLEAARCLADGGLLVEAIERFEKLRRWLDAADLHERLGNVAQAEAAVRRVVAERIERADILGAAELLDKRLKKTDEALEILLAAWPASAQAASCFNVALQILARLGRHDAVLKRLTEFRRSSLAARMIMPLLTVLQEAALRYPHEPVRHFAADFSRVLIARQLSQPVLSADEAGKLLQNLTRLAPEDRLLARDTNRHLANWRTRDLRAPRVTGPRTVTGADMVLVHKFELPRHVEWLQLRTELNWFYAVGVTPKRLFLTRGVWEGELQSVSWDCASRFAKNSLIVEPTGDRGASIAVATVGGPHLNPLPFPATDAFFFQACNAATPVWFGPDTSLFAFGAENRWSGYVAAGRGILGCYDKQGRMQRTLDVTDELLGGAIRDGSTRLCLTALGNDAAMALGNRLVLTRGPDSPLTQIELPGQVIGLVPTLPHTRPGVVALLESGAALCWQAGGPVIELDRDIASPMAAFVSGGPLVLASGTLLMLLDVDARGVAKVSRVQLQRGTKGVVGTGRPGQFAILDAQGEITVYCVGGRA